MKFAILSEHRDFFNKQRTIEFERLLTDEQVIHVGAAIDAVLAERLAIPAEDLDRTTTGKQFMAGHDLWRESAEVQKIVKQKQLAEIASDLIEERGLRLGFDQFFPEFKGRVYKTVVSDAYHDFLTKQPLSAACSIEGILCGVMLCLSGSDPKPAAHGSVFSNKAGNGVFIHPEALVDFKELTQHPLHKYLLIVYTKKNATYKRNDADPHTHSLKNHDYIFGEKLKDKYHPMIYR